VTQCVRFPASILRASTHRMPQQGADRRHAMSGGRWRNIGDVFSLVERRRDVPRLDLSRSGDRAARVGDPSMRSGTARGRIDPDSRAHSGPSGIRRARPGRAVPMRQAPPSRFAGDLAPAPLGRSFKLAGALVWGDASVLADRPEQADDLGAGRPRRVASAGRDPRRDLCVESAYFIPRRERGRGLCKLGRRGSTCGS